MDFIYLGVVLLFFLVSWGFIKLCERLCIAALSDL